MVATSEVSSGASATELAGPSKIPVPPAGAEEITTSTTESSKDDSDEDDFQDVADDRFSTVPLQTPTTSTTVESHLDVTNKSVSSGESPRPRGSSVSSVTGQKSPNGSPRPLSPTSTHRTTLPASSDGTPGDPTSGLPYMMARQKERLDSDPHAQRASIDGSAKLKAGFEKIHQEAKPSANEIDWEFWGTVVADYETVARDDSPRLAKAIEQGIPNALRGHIWQLMSVSKDADLEQVYSDLLKESSPHEKAIMRDLGRTFPQHAFFTENKGIGQENLFNVLKAYSLYDPEVGYCQGLAFIVAVLLLNMPDEEAFCVFVRLMQSYNLRTNYLPEMPGLQLRLYQFDRLVEEFLPVLYTHFLRQGVKSSMYCSQWFLTMFSYRFPLPIVYRIFDHLFATGVESIFGFSLVLLQSNEESLLKLKFDSILDYLKSALFDAYLVAPTPTIGNGEQPDAAITAHYQADRYVQDALGVRITPFQLDNYASEWEELRRQQTAHTTEMDNLRQSNRALQAQVKELQQALAQMNEDHVEIVKQLVMAKVEKEDMETELVKYKVLWVYCRSCY
ncbi:RabGAP/TBC [Clavulina sp. PMI_390]|nr:RabGAP/TBC [Clavulina sp. PMI_390]